MKEIELDNHIYNKITGLAMPKILNRIEMPGDDKGRTFGGGVASIVNPGLWPGPESLRYAARLKVLIHRLSGVANAAKLTALAIPPLSCPNQRLNGSE